MRTFSADTRRFLTIVPICLSLFIQDETEARIVHRTLTELVEQQDPGLLGANLGQVRHDEPEMRVRVVAGIIPRVVVPSLTRLHALKSHNIPQHPDTTTPVIN